jgi:hypothetical protein
MFFIDFLRSAGATIEQCLRLEKRWSLVFRRNSMTAQQQA